MKFGKSKNSLPSQQTLAIGLVVLLGLAGGVYLLASPPANFSGKPNTDHAEHGDEVGTHEDAMAENKKGPHGGRLFVSDNRAIELTIFERGVPPQFRIYTYRDGKPTDPTQTKASVTLTRLGRQPQIIHFTKESDYLKGDAVVTEPHSFSVKITAQSGDKSFAFEYEQVEARVSMSDAQLKSNGVEIGIAGPARIQTTLELIGEVRLNEDKTVRIVPRLNSIVESVSANAGDRVRKGQIVAVVSSQSSRPAQRAVGRPETPDACPHDDGAGKAIVGRENFGRTRLLASPPSVAGSGNRRAVSPTEAGFTGYGFADFWKSDTLRNPFPD